MNPEPLPEPTGGAPSPIRGRRTWLAWIAIGLVIELVVLLAMVTLGDSAQSLPERAFWSVLITLLVTLVVYLVFRFLRWLCCWRNFRRFAFGVACFLTVIALFYAEENVRGRRAWLKHKAALEARGEVLTLASLLPPPVPNAQNFALTPLLGPALDFRLGPNGVTLWQDTNGLERLQRISPNLAPRRDTNENLVLGSLDKGRFADLNSWREFYRGNTNYQQAPLTAPASEAILTALAQFAPELDELKRAMQERPATRFPIHYEYEPCWAILLPHLAHLKRLTMLTHVQAVAELDAGRPAAARADLQLGWRLSDGISNEPLLIDHLVRVATLSINLQTIREGLVRHAWDEASLVAWEKQLAGLNLLAEYRLAQRGERALSTTSLDFSRRQGFRNNPMMYLETENGGSGMVGYVNPFPSGWFYQNMLTISQLHEDFILAGVDAKGHRVFPQVAAKADQTMAQMKTGPYTLFAKLLMPALTKAVRRSAHAQVMVDAGRIACALERFRLARGALPEQLGELVPQWLDHVPPDVIDGQPLRYRRDADGGYLIYSIGWNEQDDAGKIALNKGKDPGVDFANGDWVWQMPARLPAPAAVAARFGP